MIVKEKKKAGSTNKISREGPAFHKVQNASETAGWLSFRFEACSYGVKRI